MWHPTGGGIILLMTDKRLCPHGHYFTINLAKLAPRDHDCVCENVWAYMGHEGVTKHHTWTRVIADYH